MSGLTISTSTIWLEQKIRAWASKQGISEPIIYTSLGKDHSYSFSKNEEYNIFLLGDGFAYLSRLIHQGVQVENLFVLSIASKNVLEAFFPSLRDKIQVIPRYELFEAVEKDLFHSPKRFIYSGRISNSKNFHHIFFTVWHLIQNHYPEAKFIIYGKPDIAHNIDQFCDRLKYKSPYHELINLTELDLKLDRLSLSGYPNFSFNKSQFEVHTDLSSEEWCSSLDPKHDILINLSAYYMEDFGASIAQAQAKGVKCILSPVGGHRDVTYSVCFIPPELCFPMSNYNCPFSKRMEIDRGYLTSEFIKLNINESYIQKNEKPSKRSSERIDLSILRKELIDLEEKFNFDFRNLHNEEGLQFSRTYPGQSFFLKYFNYWKQKPQNKKYAILSTSESFQWFSMQEILPAAQSYWYKELSKDSYPEIFQILPGVEVKTFVKQLLEFETIIVTKLTPLTSNIIILLRSISSTQKFLIYTHEIPTLLALPYVTKKTLNHLLQKDIFITSSARDAKLIRATFESPQVEVLPYKFPVESTHKSYPNKLIYAGRISEQKNLHTLILSIFIAKNKHQRKNIILDIYGKEDHLGNPNFGKSSSAYLDELKALRDKLDLQENIRFHDFISPQDLNTLYQEGDSIYTSPSLHYDENFGIAPFDALMAGTPCILSDWGGYGELKKFASSDAIIYTPVFKSKFGPCINPFHLAEVIDKKLDNACSFEVFPYKNTKINLEQGKNSKLEVSHLSKKFIKHKFNQSSEIYPHYGKVFKDFSDPFFHYISKCYGMKNQIKGKIKEDYFIVPWCSVNEKTIEIDDFYCGKIILKRESITKDILVKRFDDDPIMISKRERDLLWKTGRLY